MTDLNRRTFSRFKYAEEFARILDLYIPRPYWRLTREKDEEYEEDGGTYTRPLYVVEWFERGSDD